MIEPSRGADLSARFKHNAAIDYAPPLGREWPIPAYWLWGELIRKAAIWPTRRLVGFRPNAASRWRIERSGKRSFASQVQATTMRSCQLSQRRFGNPESRRPPMWNSRVDRRPLKELPTYSRNGGCRWERRSADRRCQEPERVRLAVRYPHWPDRAARLKGKALLELHDRGIGRPPLLHDGPDGGRRDGRPLLAPHDHLVVDLQF